MEPVRRLCQERCCCGILDRVCSGVQSPEPKQVVSGPDRDKWWGSQTRTVLLSKEEEVGTPEQEGPRA